MIGRDSVSLDVPGDLRPAIIRAFVGIKESNNV